jgi:carboxypeptidase family protein
VVDVVSKNVLSVKAQTFRFAGCLTIHDQAWLAEIIVSAVHFGVWQKLQLVSCILPLTLQEQKIKQSLTQAKGNLVQTTSNTAGNYMLTHLAAGDYNVRGEASGFKSKTILQVRVFADQGARVDVQLEIGVPTESVIVSAEDLPLLKTDRSDVATTFTDREMVDLPLFDRNFTELEIATPGAKRLDWQHASSENPQGGLQIVINGQHFGGTSFVLDGTDNRDPILGIIVINPTLESVSETRIVTSNFDAEFGQAAGAVISTTTKSGSNALHGSGFAFRRSNFLRARNPFTQPSDQQLPDTNWNQFGGSVGGPIQRNKIFFFADYQATRRNFGGSQLINVPAFPSLQARQECLAGVQCDLSLYSVPIFDPATGNPDLGSANHRLAFTRPLCRSRRCSDGTEQWGLTFDRGTKIRWRTSGAGLYEQPIVESRLLPVCSSSVETRQSTWFLPATAFDFEASLRWRGQSRFQESQLKVFSLQIEFG